MTQLMNLPASFEPNRGSGRSCVLLAVNFRAMNVSPAQDSCEIRNQVCGSVPRRRASSYASLTFDSSLLLLLGRAGRAAFLRWAPYFERACLRSATPWQSRTPRTM